MSLLASTKLVNEKQLEPTDFARFNVTLRNTHKHGEAKNVRVTAVLKGGGKPGVEFLPDDRWFGDIAASCEETREFAINTERAASGPYDVVLILHYTYEFPAEQCATLRFDVCDD
jgi:hypothetical protein